MATTFSKPLIDLAMMSMTSKTGMGISAGASVAGMVAGGWGGISAGRKEGHGWTRSILMDGGIGGGLGKAGGALLDLGAHMGYLRMRGLG